MNQWPAHVDAIRVGNAAGYTIEPIFGIAAQRFVDAAEGRGLAELEAEMGEGARRLAGGRPSLLQDVMRGRRTEIEELNGFIVTEGQRLGLATPFNAAIVAEVQRHGVGTLRSDPANLQPLARLLPASMLPAALASD